MTSEKRKPRVCPTCNSVGFDDSVLGDDRCEFCDGSVGGRTPSNAEITRGKYAAWWWLGFFGTATPEAARPPTPPKEWTIGQRKARQMGRMCRVLPPEVWP